jgi:hypothetical protein
MVQISYSVTVYTDQRIDVETLFCGVPRFTNIFVRLGADEPWFVAIMYLRCIRDAYYLSPDVWDRFSDILLFGVRLRLIVFISYTGRGFKTHR